MNKIIAQFSNFTNQTLGENATILFNVNTSTSPYIRYNTDGGIQLKAPGTYLIQTNFNSMSMDGPNRVEMYEGNLFKQGAFAQQNVDMGADANLSFNTLVTVKPTCDTETFATIYFKNIFEGFIINANVIIEKVI